jgi:penicillin-binding protein 1A
MFVLTNAIERGINPYSTRYLSAPLIGPDNWRVHTFENTYSGRIPLTQATLESDNTVYARLTLDLGPQPIAGLAHRMGIQSRLKPVPSIVLGVNAVSPLDLATAYATLADGGVAHNPTILSKVVFPDGHTENASKPKGKQIVDPKVAAAVTKVLEANVRSGTGTAAALPGRPVAGKTGTTDSFADAWFAGWVPQLMTVSWVGYPTEEKPMQGVHGIPGVTGGTLPAEIWHTFMTGALQGEPVEQFATPGTPPYLRWCGRYQFARTWHDARKHNRCTHKQKKHEKHEKKGKTTTQRKTTTAKATTAPATTFTIPTTTSLPPTTTKKKPPPPPPTTTTTPTTTTPTTTTTP